MHVGGNLNLEPGKRMLCSGPGVWCSVGAPMDHCTSMMWCTHGPTLASSSAVSSSRRLMASTLGPQHVFCTSKRNPKQRREATRGRHQHRMFPPVPPLHPSHGHHELGRGLFSWLHQQRPLGTPSVPLQHSDAAQSQRALPQSHRPSVTSRKSRVNVHRSRVGALQQELCEYKKQGPMAHRGCGALPGLLRRDLGG